MARFSIDIDTPPKQRPPPTPPTQVRSPFTSTSAATTTAGSASSSTTPRHSHRHRRVPESSATGRSLRRSQYRSHRENVSLPRLWTCLAPDGRSILSLSSQRGRNGEQEFLIEWQPLSSLAGLGQSQHNHDEEDLPTELKEARTMFQSPSTPLEMSRKSSSSATAATVLIPLPDHVQDALRRHAPLELICVDADPSSSSSIRGKFVSQQHRRDLMTPDRLGRGSSASMMALPILCVYTSKDAFLLELAVPSDGSTTINPMDSNHRSYSMPMSSPPPAPGTPGRGGKVLAVSEPFESQLLEASYSTRIVRIRPAPQFRMGYETLCRSRAMAMLTYDREANRYALTLCHGNGRLSTAQQQGATSAQPFTTQPLSFGMESLDEQDSITDFCFAQSEGLALFSSMSVLLLQESGKILCASPVVFDGTVVSRESVQKCLTYLDDERSSLDLKSAKAKQYKAAHMYLEAVFGEEMEKTRNTYLTARIQASLMHKEETAVEWPLAIQGPILVPPQDAMDSPVAVSLEPFFAPKLVGVAVGRGGGGVDLALLTPSGLLPRFVYERQEDGFRLNDDLQRLGVVVERIVVETNQESGETPSSSQPTNTHHNLIPDPAINTLLHSASAAGVVTISTNIMHVSSQGLCGEKENDPDGVAASTQMEERSTAWSSLNVTTVDDGVVLQGAVVTRDSLLGHVMIARLSNGSLEFVNITEARSLYDMDATAKAEDDLVEPSLTTTPISNAPKITADAALAAIEAIPPLYEIVEPLMKRVATGLASMGKVVGSETASKDISPEMLATVVALKERCDREVVLPLLELREVSTTRHRELQSMYKRQKIQMEGLRDMVKSMTERMEDLSHRLTTVESNVATLLAGGARVLEASQALQPTSTRAEQEYYDMLKGLEIKCAEWKAKLRQLEDASAVVCDAVVSGRAKTSLQVPPEFVATANDLLKGDASILKKGEARLKKLDDEVAKLTNELGA